MQISTLLGMIIGIITLIGGMILKGSSPSALINPAAIVIIFVGTTAAILNAFPMHQFVKIVTMFKILLFGAQSFNKVEIAKEFVRFAQIVRRDGLLALENIEIEDKFMNMGISMVVDGVEAHTVEDVLYSQVEGMKERHKLGAMIFSQAGMYAPTLGVLGAVIGLIAALGNLSDIEKLGHSIAAAFVATLLGIFTGYVLWHPFANKLRQMSGEEGEVRQMMLTGILALQAGDNPRVVQLKMLAFIPDKQKDDLMAEWEGRK